MHMGRSHFCASLSWYPNALSQKHRRLKMGDRGGSFCFTFGLRLTIAIANLNACLIQPYHSQASTLPALQTTLWLSRGDRFTQDPRNLSKTS